MEQRKAARAPESERKTDIIPLVYLSNPLLYRRGKESASNALVTKTQPRGSRTYAMGAIEMFTSQQMTGVVVGGAGSAAVTASVSGGLPWRSGFEEHASDGYSD